MSCHRQAYIYHLFSLSPTLLLASPLFSSFYYVLFFSHNVNTPAGSLITANFTQYLIISYHKITDVESGRLRAPSSLPELASLDIAHTLLERGDFGEVSVWPFFLVLVLSFLLCSCFFFLLGLFMLAPY
jgi:hypothetical protein